MVFFFPMFKWICVPRQINRDLGKASFFFFFLSGKASFYLSEKKNLILGKDNAFSIELIMTLSKVFTVH